MLYVHDTLLNHTHQLMKIKFMAEILHEVYSGLMNITKHLNELCSLLGKGTTLKRFDDKFSFLTLEFSTSCRASNNESATQYAADCGDTPTDDDDSMTGDSSGITLSLRCSLFTTEVPFRSYKLKNGHVSEYPTMHY